MAMSVRIHPLHENGSQRVEIGGRLDTHTYGELDDRLTLVLASKVRSLLLDLAPLEYISSAGVRSVFRAPTRSRRCRRCSTSSRRCH